MSSIFNTPQFDHDFSINKQMVADILMSVNTILFGEVVDYDSTDSRRLIVDILDTVASENINIEQDTHLKIPRQSLRFINILNFNYKPVIGDQVCVLVPCDDNTSFLEETDYKSPAKFNLGNAVAIPIILSQDTSTSGVKKVEILSKNGNLDELMLSAETIAINSGNSKITITNSGVTIDTGNSGLVVNGNVSVNGSFSSTQGANIGGIEFGTHIHTSGNAGQDSSGPKAP